MKRSKKEAGRKAKIKSEQEVLRNTETLAKKYETEKRKEQQKEKTEKEREAEIKAERYAK
jgi:hypothetical protein